MVQMRPHRKMESEKMRPHRKMESEKTKQKQNNIWVEQSRY